MAQLPGPGTRLGDDLELVERIGDGGFGVVYRARQLRLGREVAVKLLHPELCAGDAGHRERFAREIELVRRLEHPNVVRLYDAGYDEAAGGVLWMATELVRGRTLEEVLDGEGPLGPVRCRRILRQILSALACAHAAGIVHRDLKPQNLMLREVVGLERDHVTVLDFGIGKLVGSEAGAAAAQARLTTVGTSLGTPLYMAPEQLTGAVVWPSTDLYAVGLLAWEMLLGTTPWRGQSVLEILQDRARRGLVLPDDALAPGQRAFIAACTQDEPAARPADARACAALLEAFETSSPAVAPGVRRPPSLTLAPTLEHTAPSPETSGHALEGWDDARVDDARDTGARLLDFDPLSPAPGALAPGTGDDEDAFPLMDAADGALLVGEPEVPRGDAAVPGTASHPHPASGCAAPEALRGDAVARPAAGGAASEDAGRSASRSAENEAGRGDAAVPGSASHPRPASGSAAAERRVTPLRATRPLARAALELVLVLGILSVLAWLAYAALRDAPDEVQQAADASMARAGDGTTAPAPPSTPPRDWQEGVRVIPPPPPVPRRDDGLVEACEAHGGLESCVELGRRLANDPGPQRDEVRAAALFRKACDGALPSGCGNLAALMVEGRGVEYDPEEAARLATQACDARHLPSCFNLGSMYEAGVGVKRSLRRSRALYRRACDGGMDDACRVLAE